MIIYLAGPYNTGNVDQNIEVAREFALRLWEEGFAVICPHLNTAHFPEDDERYLEGYLEILVRCDAVFLLPRWATSPGARAEFTLAARTGLPIFDSLEGLKVFQESHHGPQSALRVSPRLDAGDPRPEEPGLRVGREPV